MMRSMLGTSLLLIFPLPACFVLAQESSLTITEMKVDPGTVTSGGEALISCRVSHPEGTASIERVAGAVSHEEWNTTYPMLYDDGTHGDVVADDGIYSLEITAGYDPGDEEIVFIAVDNDGNEIESEPVILTIR